VRADADVAAAQAGLALAEVQAGPLLAVTTSSSYDVWKDPATTNNVVWSIGATVTYSLFDGGLARAAVAAARANLANAQAKEALALQTAQVDALTAWVSLQDAMARVDATRASEAAATEALRTAQVTRGNIVLSVSATGTVEPASMVEVRSRATGTVIRVLVDEGQRVRLGQVLVELNDPDSRHAVESYRAAARSAEAAVAVAQAKLDDLRAGATVYTRDRKSTRLNSSHVSISYAVFCLKK